MENIYRSNIIDFCNIYIGKIIDFTEEFSELQVNNFTNFIFKQLFNIDIDKDGYGLDYSTKQMTNNIGDLKIYNQYDSNKIKYLNDIKPGDLVFFHEQALEYNSPTPNNKYPGHVGIYLENNTFIHQSLENNEIVIEKLDNKWLNTLVASRNIIKQLINI